MDTHTDTLQFNVAVMPCNVFPQSSVLATISEMVVDDAGAAPERVDVRAALADVRDGQLPSRLVCSVTVDTRELPTDDWR